MKRREFLRRSALAALMATPAMQTAALVRDFGLPDKTVTFDAADAVWAPTGRVIAQYAVVWPNNDPAQAICLEFDGSDP